MGKNMTEILQFIKNNISWVQSFMSIIFTFAATVVSILTYKRAKSTVLQPIRNEVIKKQAEILQDLLKFLRSEIDYFPILSMNVILYLDELGFVLKNHEETIKNIRKQICGSKIVTKNKNIDFVEVLEPFSEDLTEEEIKKNKESKYKKAKNGEIEIEQVYISKSFYEYINKLNSFIENPFIPKKFITILKELKRQIDYNSGEILVESLEEFLKQYFVRYKDGKPNFNMYGIYNMYHRKIIESNKCIEKLEDEIREYLYIDYEWK